MAINNTRTNSRFQETNYNKFISTLQNLIIIYHPNETYICTQCMWK